MDLVSQIFSFVLSAQSGPSPQDYLACGEACPASAFNAITAAFSTLGYYAQAEWLHLIHSGGLGTWGILAYVIAGITIIISMAMGMPPRMYLWLAVGPAVFFWLTDARTPVQGVAWRVGVDSENESMGLRDMKEVWKLAEVGLLNDNYIIRNGMHPRSDGPPESGSSIDSCSDAACVSSFFAMVDHVVSDTIQQLVWIMGVSRARPASPGENSNVFSDISDVEVDDSLRMWDLTTNIKWEFVQSITAARVANNDVRQLFSQFMASECGALFMESIDKKEMTAATYSHGTDINGYVMTLKGVDPGFIGPPAPPGQLYMNSFNCGSTDVSNSYEGPAFNLMDRLETKSMPTPKALKNIAAQTNNNNSIGLESGIKTYYDELHEQYKINQNVMGDVREVLNCRTYFIMLMQGIRWEASQITYQLLRSAPQDMLPGAYAAQMLYGWDIKDPDTGKKIGIVEAPKYLENLILIHLFRNELKIAPSQITEQRLTSGQQTVKNVQDFQRINGQVSKYGELYTWALMVPYFQGKLLYFLAIAYPFAAVLVIVPGMHGAMFQWMQFWVWVKLWDLGFAMVTILERSVWAMTSNSLASGTINEAIFAVKNLNPTCIEPGYFDSSMITTYTPQVSMPVLWGEPMTALVDRLLKLSNNIDLDMSNTYYIYIMSALYFAIPAVTGQLVLGAKSGAAGMISSAIGQIASPGGSAAGQAAAADLGQKMKMAQATGRQEAFASAMRKDGLAAGVLGKSNEQLGGSIYSSAAQTKGSLFGTLGHLEDKAAGVMNSAMGVNRSLATLGGSVAGWAADKVKGTGDKNGILANLGASTAGYLVDQNRHGEAVRYNQQGLAHARNQIAQTEAGFNAQARSSIAGLKASRGESGASFAGEQAAWDSANNYAQSNSDFAAAIGLGAGYLDPGQKPTNMQGMAMNGMLGSDASSAAKDLKYGDGFSQSVGGIYSASSGEIGGLSGAATARTRDADMSLEPAGGSSYNPATIMSDAGKYADSLGGVSEAVNKMANSDE